MTVGAAALSLLVSGNHHGFVTGDGKPFFWLGDTGWMLLYRLNREETDEYLRARAAQGFNVVKVMVLEEFGELKTPNRYGALPLLNNDPATPNPKFFEHLDWVVKRAGELGIHMALTCTWGDKVGPVLWGKGPVVFNEANARAYGLWLGKRYRDAPNVVWLLGGDRPAVAEDGAWGYRGERHDYRPLWRAMAAGLTEGDGGKHLKSYHPPGGSSTSNWLNDESWLEFHLIQSGHGGRNQKNWEMIGRDFALTPPRPTLDDEFNYEDHSVNWKPENGWFDDYDVRKLAYWSLCAGGCGITYGSSPTFTFSEKGNELPQFGARRTWREGLKLLGANQLRHARALFESRSFLDKVPDQGLIVGEPGEGTHHIQACRDSNGRWAFVYLAAARAVAVRTDQLKGDRFVAWWFNPRDGKTDRIGEFPRAPELSFPSPDVTPGLDFVLVLDDASAGYPPPGSR